MSKIEDKFEHKFAEVNSVRIHYVVTGSGQLIMFLHGFPEFWYAWKKQLPEFGRDYRAVAPDMRGYNLSSKPAELEQYRIKHLVEDIRALIESMGYKKCFLVAHDWGAGVAWPFAIRHPDYVEKLIIINGPHPIIFVRELRDNPEQQKASRYILVHRKPNAEELLSRDNYGALASSLLQEGIKQGYLSEEDRKAYISAWSQPGALTGGLNYYRASHLGSFTGESDDILKLDPSLFTVKVPTLVIWGEKDIFLLPGNLDGLDKYVPNLTIKRIPDGSHWVIHEKPELVNSYIRQFIES